MLTQKELIKSINKDTHRLDRANRRKPSQTRLTLRCDGCGELPSNTFELLHMNQYGICLDCAYHNFKDDQYEYSKPEYFGETEFHDEI